MSDKYTIVSNREELDLLIKELLGKTNIKHSTIKNDNSANENNKIEKTDNNKPTESVNDIQSNIADFSEFLDFCYYRSFKLLADSIHNNELLTLTQRNAALTLSRDLMLSFPILNHLIISSFYTVRYLLNDSYMKLDEYVYFSSIAQNSESFLNKSFLNDTTASYTYVISNAPNTTTDEIITESSNNRSITLHKIKKKKIKADRRKINDYILTENADILFDSNFTKTIRKLTEKSLNSHY